ncbi:MAG: AraC family transcriptional regulator [Bryobacterales bacterium]|nr:AraC family transcriptional regulator [Bryobacterales bacterium]
MSPSRLWHLFVTEAGESPARLARRLRFGRARELLESSDLSVKEIGFALGFASQAQFVRDFRVACGSTPGRYRRAAVGPRTGGSGRSRK